MSIRNRIVVVDYGMGNIHSIVKKIKHLESFWGYAKTRLVKFKGMNKNMFELHLKECEFDSTIESKIFTKFYLKFV